MEVHLAPEVEKKLKELAAQSGREPDDVFDELVEARDVLNSCYDGLKSGGVKPIDGEEAFSRLKAKTQTQRDRSA